MSSDRQRQQIFIPVVAMCIAVLLLGFAWSFPPLVSMDSDDPPFISPICMEGFSESSAIPELICATPVFIGFCESFHADCPKDLSIIRFVIPRAPPEAGLFLSGSFLFNR